MEEHFPDEIKKGTIICIELHEGYDQLIRCEYGLSIQDSWCVQIIDVHETEIALPLGLCLDIIVKAKRKFDLPVFMVYFF
jgi:hypothetical protein